MARTRQKGNQSVVEEFLRSNAPLSWRGVLQFSFLATFGCHRLRLEYFILLSRSPYLFHAG